MTTEEIKAFASGRGEVTANLKAPFPYFGGKSRVAARVWSRFGNVPNYCEPFFGSGAVLLGRPHPPVIETVNDRDGFVANFWRAVTQDAEHVAEWADWPANENDLHARHVWLRERRETLVSQLEADPDYCDPKIAGWWVWGLSLWIGGGFCGESSSGPWQVVEQEDGTRRLLHLGDAGQGVQRRLLHLGNGGKGVTRQLLHLGDAGQGVTRKLLHLGDAGQGVTRKRLHLANAGKGAIKGGLYEWFAALQARLCRTRVCCGDFERVLGPSVTFNNGLTGVFLDPPYSHAERDTGLYGEEDDSAGERARDWALANGENPLLRIALCGYEGEHEMPSGWYKERWKTQGGYAGLGEGRGKKNTLRECIWFSPHCLKAGLFDEGGLD